MNKNKIKIEINDKVLSVEKGITIAEALKDVKEIDKSVLAFFVNNNLSRYDARLIKDSKIVPITIKDNDGYRIYSRTLKMVLYMALTKLYSVNDIKFLATINRNQFFISKSIKLTKEKVAEIKSEMKKIIKKDLPIVKKVVTYDEAIELYKASNNMDKLDNLGNRLKQHVSIYFCDGMYNYFYGAMAKSTGFVENFDLISYHNGALLIIPEKDNTLDDKFIKLETKLYKSSINYNRYVNTLDVDNIGELNNLIINDKINNLIQVSEAIHQRMVVELVQDI